MRVSVREELVECRRCGRREWREGREDFKKCLGGGMSNELNGFRMRWKAIQTYKFKMSSAWLNKPNQ
jgi:hypothetical protein